MATKSPAIVAVGGLSGSGKSSLARLIAPALGCLPGALVVRSDTARKRLAGAALTDRLPLESYTPEASAKVYAAMLSAAEIVARSGRAVVLDAVHAKPEERAAARDLAKKLGIPFQGFWLDLPLNVRRKRVSARIGDASDATERVAEAQEDYDLGPMDWPILDAGQGLETLKNQVLIAM